MNAARKNTEGTSKKWVENLSIWAFYHHSKLLPENFDSLSKLLSICKDIYTEM